MKNENDIELKLEDCHCPLGSMMLLARKMSKIFRSHFCDLEVTNSQAGLFLLLHKNGETAQSDIGKMMDLEKSTISRDLSRLVKQGYLYKAKDGKVARVGLTDKGNELAVEIEKQWKKGYNESRDLLGEKGVEALKELEKRLLDNK